MTLKRIRSFAVLACLAALPYTANAAPSFDCGKASSDAEKAICKDAALAKLDAGIARAYASASSKLGGSAAKALREDQRTFLAARDAAFGRPDEEFAERHRTRLDFLERLAAAPRSDAIAGNWQNEFGSIVIKPGTGQQFSVEAQTVDPVSGRWICDTRGEAAVENGVLAFTDGETRAEDTATIRLRQEGGLLEVGEDVKDGAVRAYCGANGFVEGTYFRVAE